MNGMRDKTRKTPKPTGSTTNASDAVNDTKLPSKPTTDEVVDHGGQESFPASDPVAVGSAHHGAKKREGKEDAPEAPTPKRRSPPDWLLNPPR
jgi:hypothetical protein